MTASLEPGLYERLIDGWLSERLAATPAARLALGKLDSAVAADRLALHVSALVERAIYDLPEKDRAKRAIELTRALIERLAAGTGDDGWLGALPAPEGRVLESVCEPAPDGSRAPVVRPSTPLLDSTLLTNARGEPHMIAQLKSEFPTTHAVGAGR